MMFDGAFMNLPDTLDFDPTIFRPDGGDLNFERDFGQWFNPEDTDTLDFDPTVFRPDGRDLNFERDFGQWFNPEEDMGAGLDGMNGMR